MSKEQLLELVAPLSTEERRQLRELLAESERHQLSPEEVEAHPMMKIVRDIERKAPMDAPPDFSINHDFYIRGGDKRES